MLSGKSNLPRSVSTEAEPTVPPLANEVRRSTLNETLTQANSNLSSMDQHPGIYTCVFIKNYFNIVTQYNFSINKY